MRSAGRSGPISRFDRGHLKLCLPASAEFQAGSKQHRDNAQQRNDAPQNASGRAKGLA
jgi:hypothetical protein